MIKKRVIVLAGILFFLVGCAKQPKDKFIEGVADAAKNRAPQVDFQAKVTSLSLSDGTSSDLLTNLMLAQLNDLELSGTSVTDKQGHTNLVTSVDLLGQTLAVDLTLSKQKAYLSTSFVDSYLGFLSAMGLPAELLIAKEDLQDISGKYIELSGAEAGGKKTISAKDAKELLSIVTEMDKTDFTEKDGRITKTFSGKELKQIAALLWSDSADSKETARWAQILSDVSCRVTYRTDKKDWRILMTYEPRKHEVLSSLAVQLDLVPKAHKKTVTLPKESQIIPFGEVEDLFSGTQVINGYTDEPETVVTNEDQESVFN